MNKVSMVNFNVLVATYINSTCLKG